MTTRYLQALLGGSTLIMRAMREGESTVGILKVSEIWKDFGINTDNLLDAPPTRAEVEAAKNFGGLTDNNQSAARLFKAVANFQKPWFVIGDVLPDVPPSDRKFIKDDWRKLEHNNLVRGKDNRQNPRERLWTISELGEMVAKKYDLMIGPVQTTAWNPETEPRSDPKVKEKVKLIAVVLCHYCYQIDGSLKPSWIREFLEGCPHNRIASYFSELAKQDCPYPFFEKSKYGSNLMTYSINAAGRDFIEKCSEGYVKSCFDQLRWEFPTPIMLRKVVQNRADEGLENL